jgi:DNA-binding transcriptional ArsR family regulator
MSEGARLTENGEYRAGSEDASPVDASADDDEDGERRRERDARQPTHEALFEALSNQRRRFVIHYLKQRNGEGPVELADLSAQVTAWEQGIDAESLSYADRKNVHTSLSQFHAPKLEELGFVEFDREESALELTDRAEAVNIYLETTSGRELAWGPYLLLVSSVLSAVVFGSLVGVPVLSELSHGSLAVFVAVTSLTSSAAFAYDTWTRMHVGHDGPPPEATDR